MLPASGVPYRSRSASVYERRTPEQLTGLTEMTASGPAAEIVMLTNSRRRGAECRGALVSKGLSSIKVRSWPWS